MAGVLASWSHATTPNPFPKPAWDELWWTTVTPRTPAVARSSGSVWLGMEETSAETGQFEVEKLQKSSASVSLPALPPLELLVAAANELSAPIAAVEMNSAITSPLMKRKAALG